MRFAIIVIKLSNSATLDSPALLFMSTSAFLQQMLANCLPIPLMEVIANMIYFPSTFVSHAECDEILQFCLRTSSLSKTEIEMNIYWRLNLEINIYAL
jgi:hypothetical protein